MESFKTVINSKHFVSLGDAHSDSRAHGCVHARRGGAHVQHSHVKIALNGGRRHNISYYADKYVSKLHLGHFSSICKYEASAIVLTYVQLSIINTARVLLDIWSDVKSKLKWQYSFI